MYIHTDEHIHTVCVCVSIHVYERERQRKREKARDAISWQRHSAMNDKVIEMNSI